jgi:hypothetical protein
VDGERELVLKHTDQQTKIVRWYRPQAITWFGPEAYVDFIEDELIPDYPVLSVLEAVPSIMKKSFHDKFYVNHCKLYFEGNHRFFGRNLQDHQNCAPKNACYSQNNSKF